MVTAILQARVSSSRLPGKVLLPVLGEPMILRQIQRIRRSKSIQNLVVATSTEKSDNDLVEFLLENQIEYFRGDLKNVLSRYQQICLEIEDQIIVRLTADCPLVDPNVLDDIVNFFINGNFDYASNTLKRTFPRGIDAEVFKRSSFLDALQIVEVTDFAKEHVTPIFYENADKFYLGNFLNNFNNSAHRWTVDTQADFEFVTRIYEELYTANPDFNSDDIIKFLDKNPNLVNLEK